MINFEFRKSRLYRVLTSDMRSLIWTLGWISIVLGFGFMYGHTQNANYELLVDTLTEGMWAILFIIYGIVLIIRCLYRINAALMYVIYIIGVWLWSYVFFSFTVFDVTPNASTEYMLFVPIIAQLWILFNHVWNKRLVDRDLCIFTIMRRVSENIHFISEELEYLNQKNVKMKEEFNRLYVEIDRMKVMITKTKPQ